MTVIFSYNIFELDAASNNGVDDIRNLIDQVRIPPQTGNYKVYIIDEVHMLSGQAFNAFLKTLEEPPKYAIFILATTEKHKVIPTILSRCQIYDFKKISSSDIKTHLEFIANKENISFDDDFGDTFGILYSLSGSSYSPRMIDRFARSIRENFLSVGDVGRVEIFGQEREKIYVEISRRVLSKYDLTWELLARQLAENNSIVFFIIL